MDNLSFSDCLHFFSIGIFSHKGAVPTDPPISLHLLCCEGLAVGEHSCVLHTAYLQQPRFVKKSGKKMIVEEAEITPWGISNPR
jgi:hypothetical protein